MKLKDAFTDQLNIEIGQAFEAYENYEESDNEWACNSYHQRLTGILVAIQSITGADTEDVMKAMISVTKAERLPYAWEQVKKGDHRGCSH